MFKTLILIILLVVFMILQGCTAVKPYQRVYLNDDEMHIGNSYGGAFGDYVHGIRTGSIIAGSKKSSGGCGCN